MVNKNVLGIIFSHYHDENIKELTEHRAVASIPYGCRYRLIDFTLSNMVNAGVDQVAVVTEKNYRSLLNHLGSGREWDLARKNGGLYIAPPMSEGASRDYTSRVLAFEGIIGLMNHSRAEYVIVADSNLVYNMDYNDLVSHHVESGADITMLYHKSISSESNKELEIQLKGDKVEKIKITSNVKEEINKYLNVFVIKKNLLISIISRAVSENITDFERGVIIGFLPFYNVNAYEYTGYVAQIDSLGSYFKSSMDLLCADKRREVFKPSTPINTKVHDEVPATYRLNSRVNNSLIADGAVIDGEVENSIIFRGVKIGKGAKVKNCILMQESVIEENAELGYVVTDKDVTITANRVIMGYESYPVFIKKGSVV